MGICHCTAVQALVCQSLRPGARIDFLSKSDTPCIFEKNMKKGFLGGGFKYFLFSPLFGEDFLFD